jgi:hypothetical protein
MSEEIPAGLDDGGAGLWRALLAQDAALAVETNPARALALEACRAKDRLDQLDELLRGEVRTWAYLTETKGGGSELVVDKALAAANTTANNLKQLIVALRLPDQATGRRPQVQRGSSPVRSSASRDRIRAV